MCRLSAVEGEGGKVIILGIDPNPKTSGYVYWDAGTQEVIRHGEMTNESLLSEIRNCWPGVNMLSIERVRSYGQVLGNETIDTVEWYGGFKAVSPVPVMLIPRPDILKRWGIANKSSDKYLKEWFVDHYPELFPNVKRNKAGSLTVKGWSDHDMAALAVAITVGDMLRTKEAS